MGVAAIICASCCAFFLQEPKDSFAAHYEGEVENVAVPDSNLERERI
jgi:NNP family nitrate/nitrite transporter-like MFS transporter